MSYLIGGGNYYTSHSFKLIKWRVLDTFVQTFFEPQLACDDDLDEQSIDDDGDDIVEDEWGYLNGSGMENYSDGHNISDGTQELNLLIGDGAPTMSNNILDYTLRPSVNVFQCMSLWEFNQWTAKITKASDNLLVTALDTSTAANMPFMCFSKDVKSKIGIEDDFERRSRVTTLKHAVSFQEELK
ncbi:hypothetical protein SERLA73DRAFT_78646 [Serpula lacrymans var. lacrymans S7.3]|uniref:Uncharacterized protein n=2 Tax=Serpula lacrymans var. lacrymans TaxID=341189 RepID=F8QDW3_SERL3|nr:uncharacterized protein SERLADRAFT_443691 [Serpula lacrymans var. lacrymans S7.9]EGN93338.1 hypothetical protein SERLA73DRAFT_78646 [Serpula lacrymans var. lacrymans S7.3]EGO18724.1 hypothetical protein SERLADRAFT_443691 [Serpula lacrymans var. lacrymans S7.9]